jgi:hypothetical protein
MLRDAERALLEYGVQVNRTWWPADTVARAGAQLDALKVEIRSLAQGIRDSAPRLAAEFEQAGESAATVLTIANLAGGFGGVAALRERWLDLKTSLDRSALRMRRSGHPPVSDDEGGVPFDRRTLSWSKAAYFLQYPQKQAPHGDALRAAARRAADGNGNGLDYAPLWRNAVRTARGRSPRIGDVEAIELAHFGQASPKHTDRPARTAARARLRSVQCRAPSNAN